jgi:hypothetical protein
MKITVVVLAAMLLTSAAIADDIARSEDVIIEGVDHGYQNSYGDRADALIVSITEAVFTDNSAKYVTGFANGANCGPSETDVIFDPFGAFDPSTYLFVIYMTNDNWWTSYTGYTQDLQVLGSYIEGGGCVMVVGQDFLYSAGGYGGFAFVQTYCGLTSVIEDVNWADESMNWWGSGGFTTASAMGMVPCWEANPYFTDHVTGTAQGVVEWESTSYGPAEGGSQADAIFSSVAFECADQDVVDLVVNEFCEFCGGGPPPPPTATERTSWGQIKSIY